MTPFQSSSTQRNSFHLHHLQPAVFNHIVSNYSNFRPQGLHPLLSSPQLFSGVQNPPFQPHFGAYNSNGVVGNPISHNNIGPVMHPYQNARNQYPSSYMGDMSHYSVSPSRIDRPFLWENGFVMKQAEIHQKDLLSFVAAQTDIHSSGMVDGKKQQQVRRRSCHGRQTSTTRQKSHLWTPQEDDELKKLVNGHKFKNWTKIAKRLPGRKGKQCRERWINYLRPNIKTEKTWTEEEEQKFIDAHREVGNKWSKILKKLPGRTENEIKNHWNAIKRKKYVKGNRKGTDSSSALVKYIKGLTNAADPPPPPAAAANTADVSNGELPVAADVSQVGGEAVQSDDGAYLSFQDMNDSTYATTDIFAEAFADKMNYSLLP